MLTAAVPIVILHRNEFPSLMKMLEAIKKNTKYPYKIFVIDNCSSVASKEQLLEQIKAIPEIVLIESQVNNWVLGFNLALKHVDWPRNAKYYVFSDSDILVPEYEYQGLCWLGYMIQQMDFYACIGKLGISLRTDDIDNKILKKDVDIQKENFRKNPKIGENIVAPVDTTLAIYRKDFFIGEEFKFSVGHASLARPYYYTCRTTEKLEARHLGWYGQTSLDINGVLLKEKIRCFAKFGGYIEPSILNACGKSDRYFYKLVRPLALVFWGARVMVMNLLYLLPRFPRKINELQAKCR